MFLPLIAKSLSNLLKREGNFKSFKKKRDLDCFEALGNPFFTYLFQLLILNNNLLFFLIFPALDVAEMEGVQEVGGAHLLLNIRLPIFKCLSAVNTLTCELVYRLHV